MVGPILCSPERVGEAERVSMTTRRTFLTSLLGAGTVGLIAACTGGSASTPAATSAPAQPTAGAAAPGATQAAPAQAASKPSAAGGTLTFAIENDIIDFDPLVS